VTASKIRTEPGSQAHGRPGRDRQPGDAPAVTPGGSDRRRGLRGQAQHLPLEVAALAVAEQECCPFFDFRIHLDGPVLHLEVSTGTDGAELLGDLFGTAA
jgi:hypothetical protein